jgi:hypothetical protein
MRPSAVVQGASAQRKRSTIRRSVVAVIAVALISGMTAGPAEARSLRIRYDGNDSPARTDIRRVVSDLSTSTVFLRIDTWQEFHRWDDGAYFIVRFDSSGDGGFDRVLEIFQGRRGFRCLLEKSEPGGDPLAIVGQRRATRANERAVACTLPRSWFPRIQRAVRFYVALLVARSDRDRAPNTGLYHWL